MLWTLTKGQESRRAEFRDHGAIGCELQLYVNDQFVSGKRYETRGIALAEADAARDALDGVGDNRFEDGTLVRYVYSNEWKISDSRSYSDEIDE